MFDEFDVVKTVLYGHKRLFDIMTEKEARIAAQTMTQAALDKCPAQKRDEVRADIMRHILMLMMM